MCVTINTPLKYKGCTLPSEERHVFHRVRIVTSIQPGMDPEIAQKVNCEKAKTVTLEMGDKVCNDAARWNVSFSTYAMAGRCPLCEQQRRYPGKCH